MHQPIRACFINSYNETVSGLGVGYILALYSFLTSSCFGSQGAYNFMS